MGSEPSLHHNSHGGHLSKQAPGFGLIHLGSILLWQRGELGRSLWSMMWELQYYFQFCHLSFYFVNSLFYMEKLLCFPFTDFCCVMFRKTILRLQFKKFPWILENVNSFIFILKKLNICLLEIELVLYFFQMVFQW
jgi:hypothetical protein